MNNHDDSKINQKDLLGYSIDHLIEAATIAFELEGDVGKLYAIMIDNIIKVGTAILFEKDLIRTCRDFDQVENEIHLAHKERKDKKRKLRIVKD